MQSAQQCLILVGVVTEEARAGSLGFQLGEGWPVASPAAVESWFSVVDIALAVLNSALAL